MYHMYAAYKLDTETKGSSVFRILKKLVFNPIHRQSRGLYSVSMHDIML